MSTTAAIIKITKRPITTTNTSFMAKGYADNPHEYSENVKLRRGDRLDRMSTTVADLELAPAVFKTCPWQPRELIEASLRQWLRCCGPALWDNQVIGMPSRAVDEAWHGLILCTARYSAFCEKAYGAFLHHHPEGGAPAGLASAADSMESNFAGRSWLGRWSRRRASSVCCGIWTSKSAWTSHGASIPAGSRISRMRLPRTIRSARSRVTPC